MRRIILYTIYFFIGSMREFASRFLNLSAVLRLGPFILVTVHTCPLPCKPPRNLESIFYLTLSRRHTRKSLSVIYYGARNIVSCPIHNYMQFYMCMYIITSVSFKFTFVEMLFTFFRATVCSLYFLLYFSPG